MYKLTGTASSSAIGLLCENLGEHRINLMPSTTSGHQYFTIQLETDDPVETARVIKDWHDKAFASDSLIQITVDYRLVPTFAAKMAVGAGRQ